jgi:probable O-glycosylation ligase (exosortase A-associated)
VLTKQLVFVSGLVALGVGGSLVLSPVYGVAVYYFFAVLRPQTLWDWALPADVRWSFFVAVAALASTALWRIGLYSPIRAAATPWYGNPQYTRTHYLFLAFAVWVTLSCFTARNPERAWDAYQDYLKIFVMFFCSTFVLRSAKELWLIYLLALAAAVYFACEVNSRYFFDNRKNLFMSQVAKDGWDNNALGLMLAMVIPMCYFAWEGIRHWSRWAFLVFIGFLLHAVLLSYSRGAMVALCFVIVRVYFRARKKNFLGLVFLGILAALPVMAGKEIQERFISIGKQDVDESAQSRWTTWKIAIQMANEAPLVGFGVRNSNLYTYDYGADMKGRTIHCLYLQIAADSGWVGMLLYIAMFGSTFLGLWRVQKALKRWDDPETNRIKAMASGIEGALLIFAFGAMFLSLEVFEMPYILILLSVQLHAITRAITGRLDPTRPAVAGNVALPYPYPYPAAPVPR